jgi:hypothetical protein
MADNENSNERITPELVTAALESRYPQTKENLSILEPQEVVAFLSTMEATDPQEPDVQLRTNMLPNLLAQLELQHPNRCLSDGAYAVLSFLDECADQIAVQAKLDRKIQALVLTTYPAVIKQVITQGLLQTLQNTSILTILDLISEHCIGWTGDLGRSGSNLLKKIKSTIEAICADDSDSESLHSDLVSYCHKKAQRTARLEKRLSESETGILRVQRAQHVAAKMINAEATGKQAPASVSKFLTGTWCDSLQFLLIHHGDESVEWRRACKLTEMLVWTVQPIAATDEEGLQRLYRLTEQLPKDILKLLTELGYANESLTASLAELEAEYIHIMTDPGNQNDEFVPMDCEDDLFNASTLVSHALLNQVNDLKLGQWFLFEENNSHDIRIKLVAKLDDVHQLLFTDCNGMKALQKGFEQFAYFLSSEIARTLPGQAPFQATIRSNLKKVIAEHQVQQQRLASAKDQVERDKIVSEITRRRAIAEAKAASRKRKATQRQREEAARRKQLEKARQDAERAANREKLEVAEDSVRSLNVGAWLQQAGGEDPSAECRLAVKLEAEDRFIFTNQTSVKVGEYTTAELAQLLALGGWEILASGDDEEDSLAKVVIRLRQDRN